MSAPRKARNAPSSRDGISKTAVDLKFAGVGNEAVRAKTGKNWKEWFALLDKAGAAQMEHKEVAAYLYETHKVDGWWSQMITVGYEQAQGKREKHERTDGCYEITVSRTLKAPVSRVFKAWQDEKERTNWLGKEALLLRSATANKYLHFLRTDDQTKLDINFYSKGKTKSQLAVQHGKLPDAQAAAKMKNCWSEKLDRLKAFLKA